MSSIVEAALAALALIVECAFQPLVTIPLLVVLLYTPASICEFIYRATSFSHHIELGGGIVHLLEILVALGIVRTTNSALNAWATNNWQIRAGSGWNWPSEVAVVTGGCSGIGRAIAEALTANEIRVAVLDVQKLPKSMEANDLLTYFHCDVSDPESIANTADKIRADVGSPSILVNNAGITGSHTILKTPSDFLGQIFDINILSHWRLVQQFVPDMVKKGKGHIVTVASVNSFLTNSANADYVAAKAAALAFHEGLTSELKIWYRAPGVKTTIAHPSWVRTPMIEASVLKSKQDPRILESMLRPEEVAGVIVRQIISRRGAQLFIPSSVAPISCLKGLPNWTQELVRDWFGKTSAVTSGSMVAY